MCEHVHTTTHVWRLDDKLWEIVLFSWCESQRLNSHHEARQGATFPHWPTASALNSIHIKLCKQQDYTESRSIITKGYDGQSSLLPSVPDDYGSDDDILAAQGREQL